MENPGNVLSNPGVRSIGCLRILFFIIFTSATFAYGIDALAQSPDDLFEIRDERALQLSSVQAAALGRIRSDRTTAGLQIAKVRLDRLATMPELNFNVIPGRRLVISRSRIDTRSGGDFSWFGRNTVGNGSAIIVAKGNEVAGTIRTDGQLYRIKPLGGDFHALVKMNEKAFPPDHPSQWNDIEKRVLQSSLGLATGDLPTGTCGSIAVLVAYTPAAKTEAGNMGALIQLAIDETNQSYMNSNVTTRIALVHSYETTYVESDVFTDLSRIRTPGDGFMDEVHSLRDQYSADVVVLVRRAGSSCGLASMILATADQAFAVVMQDCATGYYSFGHEIGHLQGARHNPEADPTSTPFSYGHGYYFEPSRWRTIMSYDCPGGCSRIQYWSNPGVSYGGVPMGSSATHHDARVLDVTSCTIANFRKSTLTPSSPNLQSVIQP